MLNCVVVVVDVGIIVDIDAQAAHDSTASNIWWIGVRQLVDWLLARQSWRKNYKPKTIFSTP